MTEGDDERGGRRWPWWLAAIVIVFLGGMASGAYVVAHQARVQAMLHLVPQATAAAQAAAARQVIVREVPVPTPVATAAGDPLLANKVSELSDKVDDIEGQARAATGDASRAEGLLVAFAARRALDRGVQLGYIEGLLRDRFGRTQPVAVATILSASRTPVTLADLQTGLDAIAPALSAGGDTAETGWWAATKREIAGMVVVRHAGEASTIPADRVARAERLLEAGQVDGALAEVLRLPDHAAAARWIVAARRYLAGRGALDRVETAALLDPPVDQTAPPPLPSPVQRP